MCHDPLRWLLSVVPTHERRDACGVECVLHEVCVRGSGAGALLVRQAADGMPY